jgi:hypothetical protein
MIRNNFDKMTHRARLGKQLKLKGEMIEVDKEIALLHLKKTRLEGELHKIGMEMYKERGVR